MKILESPITNYLSPITCHLLCWLLSEDLKTFGRLLNENLENQKALHPSVTNEQIEEIFDVVLANGAIGGKACGAGGGGCLMFYAKEDCEHLVRKKLKEFSINVIDFNFEFSGLQTWAVSGSFRGLRGMALPPVPGIWNSEIQIPNSENGQVSVPKIL